MAKPTVAKSLHGTVKLRDGNEIPQFGLGVYEMGDRATYDACIAALQAGYRHIDTAEWYENEAPVGRAVRDFVKASGVPRSDIFVTSKLMRNRSYDLALADLRQSLKEAGLEYFDLYLMHSPLGGPSKRRDVWRALLAAREQGLVKSVGVSNFGAKHIAEMVDEGVELPALNQIDLHPFMRHPDIVDACDKHGIALEAWAPLARGLRFDHPAVIKQREKHGRSAAQILLRWGLQHGYIVIPKSANPKRIAENAQVFDFELSQEDMDELDDLDEYLVTDWDVVGAD